MMQFAAPSSMLCLASPWSLRRSRPPRPARIRMSLGSIQGSLGPIRGTSTTLKTSCGCRKLAFMSCSRRCSRSRVIWVLKNWSGACARSTPWLRHLQCCGTWRGSRVGLRSAGNINVSLHRNLESRIINCL
ncbi:hypothetical protein B0T20DRAFT_410198, partial [Sordaria brevicollis]